MLLSQRSMIPYLIEINQRDYEEDLPAPACCPVTKKGRILEPGRANAVLHKKEEVKVMSIKLTELSSCAG